MAHPEDLCICKEREREEREKLYGGTQKDGFGGVIESSYIWIERAQKADKSFPV